MEYWTERDERIFNPTLALIGYFRPKILDIYVEVIDGTSRSGEEEIIDKYKRMSKILIERYIEENPHLFPRSLKRKKILIDELSERIAKGII